MEITAPLANMNMTGDEGDMATLSCTARGVPEPSITWSTSAGGRITITPNTSTDSDGFISVTSTFDISNLTRNDAMSYTCTASNTVMSGAVMATRIFTLTVNCEYKHDNFSYSIVIAYFKLTVIPDISMNTMTSVSVVMPSSVSLSCTAIGVPSPDITWIRSGDSEREFLEGLTSDNGRDITVTNTPSGMMVESTFTISSTVVLDATSYICMASNTLGATNSTATMLTVPGQ